MKPAVALRSRWKRNSRLARLGARIGLAHAGTSARKVFASTARREELSRAREVKTAQQVADELGNVEVMRSGLVDFLFLDDAWDCSGPSEVAPGFAHVCCLVLVRPWLAS